MIYGEDLVRYFSEYDEDDYDYSYQKAFSDGYEYAQREFVNKKLLSPEQLQEMHDAGKKLAKKIAVARKSTYGMNEELLNAYRKGIDYHSEGVPTKEQVLNAVSRGESAARRKRFDIANKLASLKREYISRDQDLISKVEHDYGMLENYGLLKGEPKPVNSMKPPTMSIKSFQKE